MPYAKPMPRIKVRAIIQSDMKHYIALSTFLFTAIALVATTGACHLLSFSAPLVFVGVTLTGIFFLSAVFLSKKRTVFRLILAFFASLFLSICLTLLANIRFDTSEEIPFVTILLHKVALPKSMHAREFLVTSWSPDDRPFSLNVDQATFDAFVPGDPLRIVVHRGALNAPWIKGIRPGAESDYMLFRSEELQDRLKMAYAGELHVESFSLKILKFFCRSSTTCP
jgi:hypothetical protein